ncbi:MAG: CdaR family protein [Myxococcales bacterium]|nr:CdaR family protein [Myxococcales bacterium]MDH3484923.1 CdaR family protein [Myxococcales bacterium]
MSAWLDGLQAVRFFFTENLGLKAGALGVAILMFSLVHGAEDMERNVYIDVVVQPPPDAEDMILVTDIPDRVRVRLRGSRARLNAIRQENLPPADVELKTVEEPRYYFEKEAFDLPAGVTVVGVVPPSLAFKWVPQATRELPVELLFDGELSDDLEWGAEAEVFPPKVGVKGPRDVVNSMRTVRAMEIDVSALGAGVIQRDIPLVGAPANTTFETLSVLVTLRVQAKMSERVLSPLRVDAEGAIPQSLRPRAVTARIRGPQSIVDQLNPASVLAVVNLGALEPQKGNFRVPVELRGLPDGVEAIEITPNEVTVALEEGGN